MLVKGATGNKQWGNNILFAYVIVMFHNYHEEGTWRYGWPIQMYIYWRKHHLYWITCKSQCIMGSWDQWGFQSFFRGCWQEKWHCVACPLGLCFRKVWKSESLWNSSSSSHSSNTPDECMICVDDFHTSKVIPVPWNLTCCMSSM